LFREVPPFDYLEGQDSPYEGFGEALPVSQAREKVLRSLIAQATGRVEEEFEVELSDPNQASTELENVIAQMWAEGWNTGSGDVNLLATDFGLILTGVIGELHGGELIFRSETVLDHLSIWWVEDAIEVFPFHKAYKRLFSQYGENLNTFIRGLGSLLRKT
jgi:hypothetical protein